MRRRRGQEDGPDDGQGAAEAPEEAEDGGWPPSDGGGSCNDDGCDDEDDWYRRGYGSLFDKGRLKASFGVLAKTGLRAHPACPVRTAWTIPASTTATTAGGSWLSPSSAR